MYNLWRHITQSTLVVLLLLVSVCGGYAADSKKVKVGDITTLGVAQQGSDTYIWELYDHADGVNFAITPGNCPESKARFVNGKNRGATVQVEWLEAGEYFYRAIGQGSCSSNMKVGRIIIHEPDIPRPNIKITYDCQRGVAILEAQNYTGKLLWSTGATTAKIEVSTGGNYSLVQKVKGVASPPAKVTVHDEIRPKPPMNVMVATAIVRGDQAQLLAEGCDNGTLLWYRDEALTDEITDQTVAPEKTSTYYVVCKNAIGCVSKATEVIVYVEKSTKECDRMYEELAQNHLITPNEDGSNDVWNLGNLQNYCDKCDKVARVQLFNRWGAKVYDQSNENMKMESFRGISSNTWDFNRTEKLPDGIYFYVISIDGKEKGITGYIQIVGSEEYPYNPNTKRDW